MAQKSQAEKYEFQSEIRQLLNILVYSLYKHKDVFVRELISNAVDALNKVRFESLTQKDVEDRDAELRIDIGFNESRSTLIIEDNGIGMTKEELIENIGTIAHSGTMDFLKRLAETEEKDRVDLIGRFGVGFYSSFMAAKEIHLTTRSFRKGSKAWLWKSKGDADYTIEETVKKTRGTRIELFLKKEDKEFLEKARIQGILTRYSKFIPFPVYVENERLEVMEAVWAQPKSSLKDEDYIEFYKFLENTQEEPETWLHLSSDAPVQFSAILYVPRLSFEMLGLFKTEPGVDLYSRKVLIEKGSKDIMPEYLRFMQGVIDSEDIPLNISRETIQSDVKIERIRKHVLKQILSHLKKIKDKDREQYLRIWSHFSRNLKEGVATDPGNQDKLAHLILFHSSKKPKDELLDLKEYVGGMAEGQNEIYYLTGLDLENLEKDPAMEAFREKDLEVLFLGDPLDEFVLEHLREYDGKPFKRAESADIKVEADTKRDKDLMEKSQAFVEYLRETYGERVADVRVSERLVDSPCLLVDPSGGPSIHVERILKMAHQDYQFTRKVFEINPDNPLVAEMVRIHAAKPASPLLKKLALQLLDNMLLREGVVEDVEAVVPRVQQIMLQAAKAVRTPSGKKPPGAKG
jgi:molecular chaperone HtpG